MRPVLLSTVLLANIRAFAQQLDSINVYPRIPEGTYTSASANGLAWRLFRAHATHRTIKHNDLAHVYEALAQYTPHRHTSGPLPGLTHVAIVFSGGRPLAFGVTEDLDRVINFTGRTEHRIHGWAEHLKVRALLAPLVVDP